jgi:hypothetical protein
VAVGASALNANTIGNNNTACGSTALRNNTTGKNNIGIGSNAGSALVNGSNNIDIFDRGVAGESNTIRIGTVGTQTNAYVAGVFNVTVANGIDVVIDSSGHLGTIVSSARFKENIKPMDTASDAILALQPVTYRYKHDLDPAGIPQFGLVAEQVEKVNPDLVVRDDEGKPYSVRYEAVNAMLLNEFLKAHRKIEEQERRAQQQDGTVAELRSQVQALAAALREQAAQIQKVSAQVRMNPARTASQSVASKQ